MPKARSGSRDDGTGDRCRDFLSRAKFYGDTDILGPRPRAARLEAAACGKPFRATEPDKSRPSTSISAFVFTPSSRRRRLHEHCGRAEVRRDRHATSAVRFPYGKRVIRRRAHPGAFFVAFRKRSRRRETGTNGRHPVPDPGGYSRDSYARLRGTRCHAESSRTTTVPTCSPRVCGCSCVWDRSRGGSRTDGGFKAWKALGYPATSE